MAPQPYLFSVNSGPSVSPKLWKEFYTTEHLPDIVNSGCAVRALFFEEIGTAYNPDFHEHPRQFMAVYQTEYPELLKAECHHKVRTTSGLFAKENSATDAIMQNADFDGRNYELIQEFDPKGTGEQPPQQMVTVEMHPKDVEDYDKWYRESHLDMMAQVPGYRRSLRYKLGPESGVSKGFQPSHLAIHEMDDVNIFGPDEVKATSEEPWTKKVVEDSEVFIVRGWKLILALGY